jgi:hypothetical protein
MTLFMREAGSCMVGYKLSIMEISERVCQDSLKTKQTVRNNTIFQDRLRSTGKSISKARKTSLSGIRTQEIIHARLHVGSC